MKKILLLILSIFLCEYAVNAGFLSGAYAKILHEGKFKKLCTTYVEDGYTYAKCDTAYLLKTGKGVYGMKDFIVKGRKDVYPFIGFVISNTGNTPKSLNSLSNKSKDGVVNSYANVMFEDRISISYKIRYSNMLMDEYLPHTSFGAISLALCPSDESQIKALCDKNIIAITIDGVTYDFDGFDTKTPIRVLVKQLESKLNIDLRTTIGNLDEDFLLS